MTEIINTILTIIFVFAIICSALCVIQKTKEIILHVKGKKKLKKVDLSFNIFMSLYFMGLTAFLFAIKLII